MLARAADQGQLAKWHSRGSIPAAPVSIIRSVHTTQMIRLEITMGRNIPNAGKVSDGMMNEFIRTSIMPRFEFGTFIDGVGFWKGEMEETKIFYIEMPQSQVAEMMPLFVDVANDYKRAFRQEAVLISELQTETAFV
mgnify:CR=1 FL=1